MVLETSSSPPLQFSEIYILPGMLVSFHFTRTLIHTHTHTFFQNNLENIFAILSFTHSTRINRRLIID